MTSPKIRFVIGLGNPGNKYRNSPHNLGRELVEGLQKKKRLHWTKGEDFAIAGENPAYVYLNSFMNNSGLAVAKFISRFSLLPEEILFCYDDFDLPLGKIRIRKKGSAGSHKGMKSVIDQLKTYEFPRLRMGIGPVPRGISPTDFVLRPFNNEQQAIVQQMLKQAEEAVEVIVSEGVDIAMNRFNQ